MDLKDQALISSNQILRKLENKYKNERCIIAGNGPSLNRTDLTLLKNTYVFGTNRIYLIGDRLDINFFVSVNPFVIKQSKEDIIKIKALKFLNSETFDLFKSNNHSDIIFFKCTNDKNFYHYPYNGIYQGWTVTFVCMQLAWFLGFSDIVLIGVDHSFSTKGEAGKLVISKGDDSNHFCPNYFGKGFAWQLPSLEISEESYKIAKKYYEENGGRIVDSTVNGKLEVFDKIELKKALNMKKIKKISWDCVYLPKEKILSLIYISSKDLNIDIEAINKIKEFEGLDLIEIILIIDKEDEEKYSNFYIDNIKIMNFEFNLSFKIIQNIISNTLGKYISFYDRTVTYSPKYFTTMISMLNNNHFSISVSDLELVIYNNILNKELIFGRNSKKNLSLSLIKYSVFRKTILTDFELFSFSFILEIFKKIFTENIDQIICCNEPLLKANEEKKIKINYNHYFPKKIKKNFKPLISVIMITQNNEKYLKDSINSVLNQTYNNFELIIYNDSSNDNSKEIIKSFNDTRIRYLYHKHTNIGDIRNKAIKESKGEYIFIIDGDDIASDNILEVELAEISHNTAIDCIYTDIAMIGDKNNIFFEEIKQYSIPTEVDLNKMILKMHTDNFIYPLSSSLIKKEVFNNYSFPQWEIFEDIHFIFKCLINLNFKYIPVPLYGQRKHWLQNILENPIRKYNKPTLFYKIIENFSYQELFPEMKWKGEKLEIMALRKLISICKKNSEIYKSSKVNNPYFTIIKELLIKMKKVDKKTHDRILKNLLSYEYFHL